MQAQEKMFLYSDLLLVLRVKIYYIVLAKKGICVKFYVCFYRFAPYQAVDLLFIFPSTSASVGSVLDG